MPIPEGTELARPFLPSKDFATGKRFYERLGLRKLLDADVAIFEVGRAASFLRTTFRRNMQKTA
jgi:hypothetical protein